jgi:hypothetical protein
MVLSEFLCPQDSTLIPAMIHRLFTLTLALAALTPAAFSQSHSWDTALDGDWDTPIRWSAGSTPNDPSHWAAIGVEGSPYKVTADINVGLDRLTLTSSSLTLEMLNKSFTITSATTIDNSTVNMIGSTFNGGGQFANRSLVFARGSSSIENLYNDGTMNVIGSPSGSSANLTLVAPAYSEGDVNLTSEGGGYSATLKTAAGTTFSNFGTLNFATGAGGSRIFTGAMENNFLVAVGQSATFNTGPISNLQNTFHVFPTHTATFASGCDFNMEGGVLVNDGTFRMSNSAFTWNGGELQNRALDLVNNALTNGPSNLDLGGLRMHGTSNLTGHWRSGQIMDIVGSPQGSTATFTWLGTGDQFNTGNINLKSEGGGYTSTFIIAAGAALKNNGTIAVYEGDGGSRNLNGDMLNDQGQVSLFVNTRMQTGPIENKGFWEIGADALMDFNNSMTWRQNGGDLQIDGRFYHANGVDEFLNGSVTGLVELVNSQLTLDNAFTSAFTAWVQGSSTLTGDIESGQTLHARGSGAGSTATLNLAGATENRGTLIMDSTDGGYQSTVGTTDVPLLNSGSLEVQPGAGGNRYLRGDFTNAGSLNLNRTTVMQDGPVINQGAWTIQAGSALNFNNSMEFQQNAGTLQVDGAFFHTNGTDIFNGGTVNGVVEVVNSNLTLGAAFVDPVTLLVEGSSILTGDIESGQTLHVRGSAAGSTANMGLSGATENRGDLIMDSVSGGYQATLGTVDQDLLNSNHLTVEIGAGGNRYINCNLTNDGTMQFNATTRLQDGPVLNNGSLTVAGGITVDFNSSMTFEQLAGTLQIDGTFLHSNGVDRFAGGTVNGVPRLVNSQLTLESSFTTPVQMDLMGSTALTGDVESGQTMRVLGAPSGATATTTSQAPMSNRGVIEVTSEGGGYQSKLAAPAGQELNNEGTISVTAGAGGNRYLTMALNNSGLVDLQVATTVGASGDDHLNSGTVEVHANSTFNGSSFTNQEGGRFESNVTIINTNTPMHNDGVWAIGSDVGQMHITGAWSQGASGQLEIDLGGLTPTVDHDQLSVAGTATLDGEVAVQSINGFVPQYGHQFTILTAGNLVGEFTGVTYQGDLPLGYGLQVVNLGNLVVVQVIQVIVDAGAGSKVDVRLADPSPGQAGVINHFQVNGATGNGAFYIAYGTATGLTSVGLCAAADFGIDQAQMLGNGTASSDGVGIISIMVPSAASGVTAYFQALDVERCELSTVNSFQFP